MTSSPCIIFRERRKLLGVAKLQVGVESETDGKHIAEAAVNYVK